MNNDSNGMGFDILLAVGFGILVALYFYFK